MAEISKIQLQQILSGAPAGSDPKKIIKGLVARGHNIEGLNAIKQPVSAPEQALNTHREKYGSVFGNIKEQAVEGYKNVRTGVDRMVDVAYQGKTGREAGEELSGGLADIGGGLLQTGFSPISGTASALPGIKEGFDWVGGKASALLDESVKGADILMTEAGEPMSDKQKEALKKSMTNFLDAVGLKQTPKVLKGGEKVIDKGIKITEPVIEKGLEVANEGIAKPINKAGEWIEGAGQKMDKKRNKLAESMMNSNIKVDPARGAEKFYKMSKGETIGEFLLSRDIIGTPEQVVGKLVDRFDKVKGRLDDAVMSIEGNYKFPAVENILSEMLDRFEKTNDIKNLNRVNQLSKKFDGEGLTMAENLELKRLYEKKVKTGYLKDNNSISIERATNLDSQLREAFIAEAERSGLQNIKALSREVQLSKTAIDAIQSKIIRRRVNNKFGLTDNLLLLGGAINPASFALLGLKKALSLPSSQAKIIKALTTNSIKTMKEIPNIPKKIISETNAAKRQVLFEAWLVESGIKEAVEGTGQKLLPESSVIQTPPPNPETMLETRQIQYREGTGIFEKPKD